MDIKKFILIKIREKGSIKIQDVMQKTGFTRAYINKFFRELQEKREIILVGKARNSRYILNTKESFEKDKKEILRFFKIF